MNKEDPTLEEFLGSLIEGWNEDIPQQKKVWNTVVRAMEFFGPYDWEGEDKKDAVLHTLADVLNATDFYGSDVIIDPLVLALADYAIDYLYDAFKGKYGFDG